MAARRTELNPRPSTETPLLEDARSAFTDNSATDEREDELCSFSCGALCRCFGLCWVADAEKHDAMEANKMIGRLGVWLAANTFLFACQRVAVACGLPYDGHKGWKNARWSLTALNHLCLYASGAAVFAHALTPRRAGRLFGKPANCAAFLGVALGVGVLFSIVSDVSSLRTSISEDGSYDASFVALLVILGAIVLAAFAFQIWLARRHGGVVPYLAPRIALVVLYVAYSWVLVANGDSWEFHPASSDRSVFSREFRLKRCEEIRPRRTW